MVDETQQYSAAEMERMMKVQDVLLKAMARKITWWAAAEILGVTDRTMRRWREKLEKDGYAGLADRRKGKPSAQRIPLATTSQARAANDAAVQVVKARPSRCLLTPPIAPSESSYRPRFRPSGWSQWPDGR